MTRADPAGPGTVMLVTDPGVAAAGLLGPGRCGSGGIGAG